MQQLLRRRQWPALFAVLVSVLVGSLLAAQPAQAAAGTSTLAAGETLVVGQQLISPAGQYTASISDGNLVVHRAGFGVHFRSGALAADKGATLQLTTSGNLVLRTSDSKVRWQTSTSATGAKLVLADSGNLSVVNAGGTSLWTTNTAVPQQQTDTVLPSGAALVSLDGTGTVSMQRDGNLVVRDAGKVLWSSNTAQAGSRAVVSPSLGLVVMSLNNRLIWASNTTVSAGSVLGIGDDGNLVLYSGGKVAWQSSAPIVPVSTSLNCSSVTGPVGVGETSVAFNGTRVHNCLLANYEAMVRAAAAAGVTLTGSGWRDNARQIQLRIQNCGGNTYYNVYEKPSSQCSPPTAIPGRSMHERGLAIDFNTNGRAIVASDPQFKWLAANAKTYGLYNLPSETWHWSTTGG